MTKRYRLSLFLSLTLFLLLAIFGDIFLTWREYKNFYYFVINEETFRVESVVKGTLSAGGDPVEALENYLGKSKFLKGVSYKLEGRDIPLPGSQFSPDYVSKTVKIPPFSFTLYYDVSYLSHFRKHLLILIFSLLLLVFLFLSILFLLIREYYRERLKRANETAKRRSLEAVNLAIHSIVHEVKNRLNVINLLLYRYSSTKSEFYIDKLRKELSELSRYIEETSDLRKPVKLEKRKVKIGELVKHTVNEFKELFSAREIDFSLSIEESELSIDDRKVASVLIDLLKNAVEALDSCNVGKKEIRISGRKGKGIYYLEVSDNSSLELPQNPFEPFFSTKERGFGLGLYNVKRIVEAHGGRVAAEKRSGWTVFRIELPAT